MDRLKLEVIFAAIDKITGPLKGIAKGSSETAKALKAARDHLAGLKDQAAQIETFRKVAKDAAITGNMLGQAQDRVRALKEEIAKVPKPTRDMTRALAEAEKESRTLKLRHNELIERQQKLRTSLNGAGLDTSKLASHQRTLKDRIAEATKAVDAQAKAVEELNRKHKLLYAAKARFDRLNATGQKLRDAGLTAGAVGTSIGLPAVKATKDFATFETAMLGVARQVDGARDANGRLTATYYEMADAIKAMSERLPMATTEIANIVAAGARMGIQGKQNLLIYAEQAAVMAHAFDLPVDQVGENVARIADLFKLPISRIGELGDAINWLDDNSTAKGGEIIEVLQRISGVATSVNMNFKEATALGSTFLSMGAGAEVASSATNAMIRELSIATMQTKRFRGGLEMLKLDAKAIQFGMTKDATGTILKVLDAIKALPQEKQLEAATRLFGKEFGDDAAKLVQNIEKYREHLRLANDARAKGSMDREAGARKDTIDARLLMAKNAFFNLSSDLGAKLKPALVETLERTLAIVQSVRAWAQEHPNLAGGIMSTIKWISIAGTAIGALLLAVGGIIVPIAAFKFGMASLGITTGVTGTALWAFAAPVLKVAAAFTAGYAAGGLLAVGIDALLTRLTGAPTTLGGAIYDMVQAIKARFEDLRTWMGGLPARFVEVGRAIVDGLVAGISAGCGALKSAVTGIADSTVDWLKEKLGIRSPSRVFAAIGGWTMQGLEQGLLRGQDGPLAAVARAAKGMAAAGATLLAAGPAMAMPQIDHRPPLSPASFMAAPAAPMIVQITINAAPGMDEQAIARQVAAELQRIEAQRAARGRSRLRDAD